MITRRQFVMRGGLLVPAAGLLTSNVRAASYLPQRRKAFRSFNPATYGTVKLWFAARKESYADNDAVGTITDWGTNSLSATQATAAKKPAFKTGVLGTNNVAAYRHDGGDTTQTPSFSQDRATFTMVVVLKQTTSFFIEHGPDAAGAGASGFFFYGNTFSTVLFSDTGALTYCDATTGSGWVGSSPCVVAATFNGTAWTIYKNASSVGTSGCSGGSRSGSYSHVLNVFSRNQSSLFTTGDLGELILFSSVLTSTQIGDISAALNTIYGLY